LRGQTSLGRDIPVKRKDGSFFYADINAFPLTLAGSPYLMGIFRDITERKQAEAELEQYRTRMARAEQLASLGTVSATLAHELNQPLTVIRLSVENALEDLQKLSSSDGLVEELTDSLNEIANAAEIVNRFRTFAKKSADKTIVEVDLKATAERIFLLLSENARRAKINLTLEDMDRLPHVYSNEKDLEQLFFALTENAIQAATGKRKKHFTISGRVENEHVKLRFADDCCGIKKENLKRIFDPFFTTGPDGTRTGLGLSIVQRIISQSGGEIRVESKPGQGTTFVVTIPLRADSIA
jgi:signal transduction histidine kinase